MDSRLCSTLQPILKFELLNGNTIESVEAPAGTRCPFAIILKKKMNHTAISKLTLSNTVERWESKDRHYSLQEGYSCSKYNHSISGPL